MLKADLVSLSLAPCHLLCKSHINLGRGSPTEGAWHTASRKALPRTLLPSAPERRSIPAGTGSLLGAGVESQMAPQLPEGKQSPLGDFNSLGIRIPGEGRGEIVTATSLLLWLLLICLSRMMGTELLYQHIGHSVYSKKDLVIFVILSALCIYFLLVSTPNLFKN